MAKQPNEQHYQDVMLFSILGPIVRKMCVHEQYVGYSKRETARGCRYGAREDTIGDSHGQYESLKTIDVYYDRAWKEEEKKKMKLFQREHTNLGSQDSRDWGNS